MNFEVSEGLLIFVISQMIVTAGFIWKFASEWGQLKAEIKKNHLDINRLGKALRRQDKLSWQRINQIEEFLSAKGFVPSSLNLFDD